MTDIDWTIPACSVTPHFTVKDLIWLPQWGRLATENDGLNDEIKANLCKLALAMESIRAFLGGVPIISHVAFRPVAYNTLVRGAPNSSHIKGLAMDWHAHGLDCDAVRKAIIEGKVLDALDLYMEHLDGANWVHINLNDGVERSSRYFVPLIAKPEPTQS